jgi:putative addiction module component (TIGR02574 family)
MISQSITESFRKLSPDDKIRLLEELWSEVAEEYATMPLSESHRQLLDERLQQHAENPEDVEPWETVRDDVLREL